MSVPLLTTFDETHILFMKLMAKRESFCLLLHFVINERDFINSYEKNRLKMHRNMSGKVYNIIAHMRSDVNSIDVWLLKNSYLFGYILLKEILI